VIALRCRLLAQSGHLPSNQWFFVHEPAARVRDYYSLAWHDIPIPRQVARYCPCFLAGGFIVRELLSFDVASFGAMKMEKIAWHSEDK